MMNTIELSELFERLGTPPSGRRLVEKARKEAPVRKIQSHIGNVITWYPSCKMGKDIGAESLRNEYPAIVQYEHDPSILEYYAQPCRLDIMLTDGGRIKPTRIQHFPDFLLLKPDQILIDEWKEEAALKKLAAKYPGRFVLEDDGWHYPEVEEQLAEMGITYRLRSGDEHPRQYLNNLVFLSDFFSPSCPPVEEGKLKILRDLFADKPVLSLMEMIAITNSNGSSVSSSVDGDGFDTFRQVTTDDIYKAIADEHIIFDLYNDNIAETHRAKVYRDKITLAFHQKIEASGNVIPINRMDASIMVGAEVDYEGSTYRIDLVGMKNVMLSGDAGTTEISLDALQKQHAVGRVVIRSRIHKDSDEEEINSVAPRYLEIALDRAKQLEQAKLSPGSAEKSPRTLQRYKKRMREAGDITSDQYLALVPQTKNRGNRERKIPQELIEAIETLVKTNFNTAANKNKKAVFKDFLNFCNENGLKPCSEKTFNKEVDYHKSDRARRGKRFAYQNQPIVWYLEYNEPIHGVRPFQYVHIDHTPLDLFVRLLKCNKVYKTYLSLAIDAESRRVVGFFLSFDPPSYRSCMMVLRDIVRRHGRMPEMIIVDNGKEFHSRAFKRVVHFYGGGLRYRPGGQPRHGSVLERLFGTANTQLIHNLNGNTQVMQHVRTVTKSVRPENFVEWTLPALHGALDYFFENLYGTENHPAHGEEPVKHFSERMIETGMRLHRFVRFDRTFRIETCPSPDAAGTRTVDSQRGVKINHIWYWTDAFRAPKLDGKPVDIRIDPWDVRVVYALVNEEWHLCISKYAALLRQYTEIEIRYAFEELEKEHGIKKKALTPERISEWMKVMDARNFDPRLREQQAEARLVYEPLGMTVVEQSPVQSLNSPPVSVSVSVPVTLLPVALPGTTSPSSIQSVAIEEEEEYGLF